MNWMANAKNRVHSRERLHVLKKEDSLVPSKKRRRLESLPFQECRSTSINHNKSSIHDALLLMGESKQKSSDINLLCMIRHPVKPSGEIACSEAFGSCSPSRASAMLPVPVLSRASTTQSTTTNSSPRRLEKELKMPEKNEKSLSQKKVELGFKQNLEQRVNYYNDGKRCNEDGSQILGEFVHNSGVLYDDLFDGMLIRETDVGR